MAVQLQTLPEPSPIGRTLDWMHAQVPDRYWEATDAERILELVDASLSSPQVQVEPPALRWLDTAMARLADLDCENDARLRDQGMLVDESDLFLLA